MNGTLQRPKRKANPGSGPRAGGHSASRGLSLDREITGFCRARGGKCFALWPTVTLHAYVCHHLREGTAIYARNGKGQIAAVLFCMPVNEGAARCRAARGDSHFDFMRRDQHPDCFLVAEVVGSRQVLNKMDWPDLEQLREKKFLTYRRDRLVELRWPLITRFLYGRRDT